MEAKIRHLEMIRGAIDGASGNSLRIKGFAMLLLAGTVALALREDLGVGLMPMPITIVLLIIIALLGLLDFYFIRQADLYEVLYNEVQVCEEDDIDFSMETAQYDEELNRRYRD